METSKKRSKRNQVFVRHRKTDSKKIVDRITYNPMKHKQLATKNFRAKLQQKKIVNSPSSPPSPKIKFGSFNVNGLDIEAAWAIEQLLTKRGFDVSLFIQ